MEVGVPTDQTPYPSFVSAGGSKSVSVAPLQALHTNSRNRPFFNAYDALLNRVILRNAIKLAIQYQKLLMDAAILIIDVKSVVRPSKYLIAILKADNEKYRIFGTNVQMTKCLGRI